MNIDKAIEELLDESKSISEESKQTLFYLFEDKQGKELLYKWVAEHSEDVVHNSEIEVSQQMLERMYGNIRNKIASDKNINSFFIRNRFIEGFQKVAAVLIVPLLLGAAAIIFHYSSSSSKLAGKLESINNYDIGNAQAVSLKYVSPAGSRLKLLLSDSTEVTLNGNSTLTVSRTFGKNDRCVSLVGEGYFDVAKDTTRTFIVSAGGMEVAALGTSFYVKAYPDENIIETVLISGKISVSAPEMKGEEKMVLLPNQKYRYNKASEATAFDKNISTRKYKVWKDGELVFEDESMSQIINRLEHFYNVDITVEDQEIYSYRFTASLDNCSCDQIMEYIKLSSPIDYKIDKNRITLFTIK